MSNAGQIICGVLTGWVTVKLLVTQVRDPVLLMIPAILFAVLTALFIFA